MQGVYVLTDNSFKPLTRMSAASSSEAVQGAQPVEPRIPWSRDCERANANCSSSGFHVVSYGGGWQAWGSTRRCKRRHRNSQLQHSRSRLPLLNLDTDHLHCLTLMFSGMDGVQSASNDDQKQSISMWKVVCNSIHV